MLDKATARGWGVMSNNIHMDTKIDYVNIRVPRELKDQIKTAAAKKGISIIKILKQKFGIIRDDII